MGDKHAHPLTFSDAHIFGKWSKSPLFVNSPTMVNFTTLSTFGQRSSPSRYSLLISKLCAPHPFGRHHNNINNISSNNNSFTTALSCRRIKNLFEKRQRTPSQTSFFVKSHLGHPLSRISTFLSNNLSFEENLLHMTTTFFTSASQRGCP